MNHLNEALKQVLTEVTKKKLTPNQLHWLIINKQHKQKKLLKKKNKELTLALKQERINNAHLIASSVDLKR